MNDEELVRGTIQTYYESMYESSADKVRTAFHPSSFITGYIAGRLREITVDQFAATVANAVPSDKDRGLPETLSVLFIDVVGRTAVARVRGDFGGVTYLDTLSFIKSDDGWRIYNKLFHEEGRSSQINCILKAGELASPHQSV